MARPSWNSKMYIVQNPLWPDNSQAVICHKMYLINYFLIIQAWSSWEVTRMNAVDVQNIFKIFISPDLKYCVPVDTNDNWDISLLTFYLIFWYLSEIICTTGSCLLKWAGYDRFNLHSDIAKYYKTQNFRFRLSDKVWQEFWKREQS